MRKQSVTLFLHGVNFKDLSSCALRQQQLQQHSHSCDGRHTVFNRHRQQRFAVKPGGGQPLCSCKPDNQCDPWMTGIQWHGAACLNSTFLRVCRTALFRSTFSTAGCFAGTLHRAHSCTILLSGSGGGEVGVVFLLQDAALLTTSTLCAPQFKSATSCRFLRAQPGTPESRPLLWQRSVAVQVGALQVHAIHACASCTCMTQQASCPPTSGGATGCASKIDAIATHLPTQTTEVPPQAVASMEMPHPLCIEAMGGPAAAPTPWWQETPWRQSLVPAT